MLPKHSLPRTKNYAPSVDELLVHQHRPHPPLKKKKEDVDVPFEASLVAEESECLTEAR